MCHNLRYRVKAVSYLRCSFYLLLMKYLVTLEKKILLCNYFCNTEISTSLNIEDLYEYPLLFKNNLDPVKTENDIVIIDLIGTIILMGKNIWGPKLNLIMGKILYAHISRKYRL